MANKKNEVPKKPKTVKKTPSQVPPTVNTEKKDNKKEVKVVDSTPLISQLQGKVKTGLDINHQVDLLKMSHDIFGTDPDAKSKYGEDLVEAMNLATATGVVVTMATVATTEDTPFAAAIRANCLPSIIEAGKQLGININTKMLPPAENGTVKVPANAVEVSEETKEKIKKEVAAAEEVPELDPDKVVELGEEALKKALTYIAVNKKGNIFQSYVDLYTFYRSYCYALAAKAENTEEATKKYDAYTPADWFNSAFEKIEPTLLIGGIGRGMCAVTFTEGSPIHAYCILRDTSKKEKASVPTFTDTELADMAKGFIKAVANHHLAHLIEARDNAKALKEEKAFNDACANIDMYQKVLTIVDNPDFGVVEHLIENHDKGEDNACRIYKAVKSCFYEDANAKKHYKNLDSNIQQYAGIISNMFADTYGKSSLYGEEHISELQEYTDEEWKALQKEKLAKKHEKNSEGDAGNAQ